MGCCTSISPFSDPLKYYETSDVQWTFGEQHLQELEKYLKSIDEDLESVTDTILSYMYPLNADDIVLNFDWNHPNYTTYIHIDRTPLNGNTDPLPSRWLEQIVERFGFLQVITLGAANVGKSNLTFQFIKNLTADFDVIKELYHNKRCALNVPKDEYDNQYKDRNTQRIPLQILDSEEHKALQSGKERLELYEKVHIFLLVFSVMRKETFNRIKRLREMILKYRKSREDFVMIAVGNKCDMRLKVDSSPDLDMNEVHKWCTETQTPYVETSTQSESPKNVYLLYRQSIYEYYQKQRHLYEEQ